ncbi:hypothetical protein Lal_00015025 [Lupinus albus]|nr:hypothetical protein Lal_00015025 [Lupinus albus]
MEAGRNRQDPRIGPAARAGPGRLHGRHRRSARHPARGAGPVGQGPCTHPRHRFYGRPVQPRRARRVHGEGHPGHERLRSDHPRRPDPRGRPRAIRRPADVHRRRRQPRPGPPRGEEGEGQLRRTARDSDAPGRPRRRLVRAAADAPGARRCRGRIRTRAAARAGRVVRGRPGTVLSGRADLVRDPARERRHARAVLHAAPERDAARRGACAGPPFAPRRRRVPPHGRWLRRQGIAVGAVGRRRVHRRETPGPPRQVARGPRRRHDGDRQAPLLPLPVRSGLRRFRPHPRGEGRHGEPRGLFRRPVRPRRDARRLPLRQHLLPVRLRHPRGGRQDEHAVEHGVPRLRRSAGRHRHRVHHRRDRAQSRQGCAGHPQAEFLRQDRPQRDAVRPARRRQRDPRTGGRAGGDERLPRAPRGDPCVQRDEPRAEERPGADAREIRHRVQRDAPEPGRRTRARVRGRLHPRQPRRHGDGAGRQHEGDAGRRARTGRRSRPRAHRRDEHEQGRQYVRDGRVDWGGPERQGRAGCGAPDPRTPRDLRRDAVRRRCRGRALRRGHRVRERPRSPVRRTGRQGLPVARAAVVGRLLCDAEPALGSEDDDGQPVLLLRVRRGRGGSRHRYLDGRMEAAARGRAVRRRQFAEPRHRHRPGGGRVHPGHGLADDGRTVVECPGQADDACAVHVQDPGRVRLPGCVYGEAVRQPQRGRFDPPFEGRRRTAAAAAVLRVPRDPRRHLGRRRPQGQSAAARAGHERSDPRRRVVRRERRAGGEGSVRWTTG